MQGIEPRTQVKHPNHPLSLQLNFSRDYFLRRYQSSLSNHSPVTLKKLLITILCSLKGEESQAVHRRPGGELGPVDDIQR